jgi:hypothetical protein
MERVDAGRQAFLECHQPGKEEILNIYDSPRKDDDSQNNILVYI